jgi:hypothetical protein
MSLVGLEALPHLSLTLEVVRDRERHQVLERDLLFTVKLDELRTDIRELEPSLHDERRDAKSRSDVLDRLTGVDELAKRLELISRMHVFAAAVLSQANLERMLVARDQARNFVVWRDVLLFDQQLQRTPAPSTCDDAIRALASSRLFRIFVNRQVLQDALRPNQRSEFFDALLLKGLPYVER